MVSVTAQYTWRQISSSGLLARTAWKSGLIWSKFKLSEWSGVKLELSLDSSLRRVPRPVLEDRRRVIGIEIIDRRLYARSRKSKQRLDGHLGNVGLSHSPCWPS